jgi:hypothetical protein
METTMKIHFRHVIHQCIGMSTLDRVFGRVVEMPYCPPVGMEVIDGEFDAVVESLVYCNGVTYAFTAPDTATGYRLTIEMDRRAAEAIEAGWSPTEHLFEE